MRVGAGLGGVARLRTNLGASGASLGAPPAAGSAGLGASALATTRSGATAGGAGGGGGALSLDGAGTGAGALSATAAGFEAWVVFAPLGSSGCTWRRRPSASARRRMRSAWASSMDADGLEAPMPNF